MSGLKALIGLAGRWIGPNQVLLPGHAPYGSQSTVVVTPILRATFVQLAIAWAIDGEPQEGLLLVGHEPSADVVTAVWIDTWHMGDKFMVSRGQIDANGAMTVRGSYVVEGGPDWGWRTVLEPEGDTFRLTMYNVSPDGEEALGVEARYTRAE